MTTPRMQFSFPIVAVIRKGSVKSEKAPGRDLKDQMRVVFYPGADEYKQLFLAAHPECRDQRDILVKKISAMTPFQKIWDSIEIWNEAHQAGRMVLRASDTQVITRRDPKTGEYLVSNGEPYEEFYPGQPITYERNGKPYSLPVKTMIRMRLFLPELARMVMFELRSTSYYDACNLRQQLGAIQMLADMLNGGVAGGIPFTIFRRQQDVTWNKADGSASRVSQWLLQVEIDPQWVASATRRMTGFALTGQQIAGLLEPVNVVAGSEDPNQGYDDPEEDENYADEITPPEPSPEMLDADPVEETQPDPASQLVPDLRYTPAQLQEKVKAAAKWVMDHYHGDPPPATNEQRELVKEAMEQALADEADIQKEAPSAARGHLQFYLTGFRSLDKAGAEYVLALEKWLDVSLTDQGIEINPMARREAIAAYQMLKERK